MSFLVRRRILLVPLLGLCLWGVVSGPRLAWADIKLCLKDGTYQFVKSYEVRGIRVRYYSVERSEWEEVPKSLVDFEATKRAEQEVDTSKKKALEEARELEKQRFETPEQSGFEVAPGIRLPKYEGVFAFDGVRVIPMMQSSAEVVKDKKRAALLLTLPAPVLKNRVLVVLPGDKAAVRLSVNQPTFYAQFGDNSGANLELIAIKPSKESRLVERIPTGIGVGKSGELRTVLPVERTAVAPGLFRIKPVEALTPGEYALGELLQEKLNLELWDFGVDGVAPPAKTAKQKLPPSTSQPDPSQPR
jgi:hypothetical protein